MLSCMFVAVLMISIGDQRMRPDLTNMTSLVVIVLLCAPSTLGKLAPPSGFVSNERNGIEIPTRSLKTPAEKVVIEVYYESLCPDSQRFITEQLYPTWKTLGKYMEVKFFPFGKASVRPIYPRLKPCMPEIIFSLRKQEMAGGASSVSTERKNAVATFTKLVYWTN